MLTERLEDYEELFEQVHSEKEKLSIIIELGKELAEPSEQGELIAGCVSKTWVRAQGSAQSVHYQGWAQALVIRGYVKLLIDLLSGLSAQDIIQSEKPISDFLNKTQLGVSMLPSRNNSFERIYHYMKEQAKKILNQ